MTGVQTCALPICFYLQTGQIWNGGEVPIIDDKLFLSIVDELRQPVGKKEGKAWWTRLPIALTILQADSIGLKVTKALPYDEDLSDFEHPSEVPRPTGLHVTGAQIGVGSTQKIIEFTVQNMDGGNYKPATRLRLRAVASSSSASSWLRLIHWSISSG